MTNQELYSKVRTHLLTQNRKSLNTTGACAYRGEDGTRCAIGCLIPDDQYDPIIDTEGLSVSMPLVYRAAGISDRQTPLASDLQRVHDVTPVNDWLDELDHVARKYDLEAR